MTFFATAGRIGATLVAMAGTRLELAAIEFQEDARRLLGHLAWTLLAVFLAAGALLLAALFVIAVFWDTYRLQAVGGMAVLFGALAAIIVLKVRASMNAEAPLLSATLAELRNDIDYLRHGAAQHAAHPAGATDE
ncbi:phage holin family protein [Massilia luteola]|uniref:phage holin family protein n=1 Tax=Massilia luteola TaxID=3081751 RepID=UPI002ACBE0B6|nr:phage holin family protein [Massilia sp. Gc5]